MPSSIAKHIKDNLVLYGALFANLGIAVAKFVAASLSGSSAMMTEGVHSLVDSGNEVLLLYGRHKSAKPPTREHPFGFGRELYFWTFVVAILIFAIGSGVSVYEGLRHIREPEAIADPTISYVVLAVAFVMEGSSWLIALREFNEQRGARGFWEAFRQSKDAPTFMVLFEDSAALIGIVIAALGISCSIWFEDPRIDGMASVAIGIVLAVVAVILARESKALLVGESADLELIDRMRTALEASPHIDAVNHIRTVHTAPDSIFVAISADFDDTLPMGRAESVIEDMELTLRKLSPAISSIYIRPEKREDAVFPAH